MKSRIIILSMIFVLVLMQTFVASSCKKTPDVRSQIEENSTLSEASSENSEAIDSSTSEQSEYSEISDFENSSLISSEIQELSDNSEQSSLDLSSQDVSEKSSAVISSSVSSSSQAGTGITYITNSLYAWWDFEDASDIGKDVSGNGHDLINWNKGGNVGQAVNNYSSKLGKAAKFQGNALLAAGTLEQGAMNYTDFIDSIAGSYTLSFFAKNERTDTPAAEDHNNLFCNGLWSNPTSPYLEFAYTYMQDGGWNAFACYLNYGAKMNGLNFKKFSWQADNGSFYRYGELDTDWYHYALVVDKEKVQVITYIDGKLIKTNDSGADELATQSTETLFSIGGMALPDESDPGECDCLIGSIDDFRVYERALSIYEIDNIASLKG